MRQAIIIILLFIFAVIALSEYKNSALRNVKNNDDLTELQNAYNLDPAFVSPESTSEVIQKGNNAARKQDIKLLMQAFRLYLNEHPEGIGEFKSDTPYHISKNEADICPLIVPSYMSCMPRDPRMMEEAGKSFTGAGSVCDCNKNYTTGFFISKNREGKIVLEAPLAEYGEKILEIQ